MASGFFCGPARSQTGGGAEGTRNTKMAINLDYDIYLQLDAAATEAEIASTTEPEAAAEDVLNATPEDLSAAALYLREVARNPLLTPREEIEFAQRNEAGREIGRASCRERV